MVLDICLSEIRSVKLRPFRTFGHKYMEPCMSEKELSTFLVKVNISKKGLQTVIFNSPSNWSL